MSVLAQLLGRTAVAPAAPTVPETVPGTQTPMPEWATKLIQQNKVSPAVAMGGGEPGEIPPWVDMTALRNAAGDSPYERDKYDTGIPTPWGFVSNLVGDVPELVGGIASLLGLAAGDVWNLGREGLERVGLAADQDKGFYTDDILQGLIYDPDIAKEKGDFWSGIAPVIQQDIKHRYGGLDNIAKSAYNDPLFMLADVLSLGELGGMGAVARAKNLLPGVADELADVGNLEKQLLAAQRNKTVPDTELTALRTQIDEALAGLSPRAKSVKRTLPGAGMGKFDEAQRGLTGLVEDIPLAGYRTSLENLTGGMPKARYIQQDINPFRRAVKGGLGRLASRPMAKIDERLDSLRRDATEAAQATGQDEIFNLPRQTPSTPELKAILSKYDQTKLVKQQAERYGLTRINKPIVDKMKVRKGVLAHISDFQTNFYGRRGQAIYRIEETILPRVEEMVNLAAPNLSKRQANAQIDDIMKALNGNIQVNTPNVVGRASDLESYRPLGDPTFIMNDGDLHTAINQAVGANFMVERNVIRVPSTSEARLMIARLQQALPGRVSRVIDPNPETGTIGQVFIKGLDNQEVYKLRIVDDAGAETLAVTDDIFTHLDEMHRAMDEMYAQLMDEAAETGDQATALAMLEEFRLAMEKQIRHANRALEDVTEWAVIGLRDGIADPMAKLLAQLRVVSYDEITRVALSEGKLRANIGGISVADFYGMRQRMFMPAQIERLALHGEVFKNVASEILALQKKGDLSPEEQARLEDLHRQLKAMGHTDEISLKALMTRASDMSWMYDDLKGGGYSPMKIATGVDLLDELDSAYMASGRATPVYFPHIDLELGTPMDYLMKKKLVGGMSTRNAARFKEFAGYLYVNGRYTTDPIEAFSRAASQVRQYQSMGQFYRELAEYGGREIKKLDDIMDGEVLMMPDLVDRMFSMRGEVELDFMKAKVSSADDFAAIIQAMRNFQKKLDDKAAKSGDLEGLLAALQDTFGANEQTTALQADIATGAVRPGEVATALLDEPTLMANGMPRPKIYAVPKVMAEQIDAMGKMQMGWKTRMYWDGPVNLWKAAVLAYSPRWIFYNLLGNMTFLKMQGGSLADAGRLLFSKLRNSKRLSNMVGEEVFSPRFVKMAEQLFQRAELESPGFMFHLRGGFFSDVNQAVRHLGEGLDTDVGQLVRQIQKATVSKKLSRGSTRMRRLNELIEESFREASFITALEKAAVASGVKNVGKSFLRSSDTLENLMKNGMDDATVSKAIAEVDEFMNNYARLGPYERNLIKRFIMPFYSFYKHIVKLTVTYPFEHPLRASVIRNMGEISREMAAEFGAMPDWLVGSVPVGQGESEGETRFLNTRGLNPFNALQNPLESLGTSITPQAKMFFEQATGRNMLTGKPFTHPNVVSPFGSSEQFHINPATGDTDPTTVRPNIFYQLATQFPQFKIFQDIYSSVAGEGPGARYSATGEVITGPDGRPLYPDDLLVNLASLGGISQTDFQLSKYQQQQAEGERLALIEWLKRNGFISEAEPV